MLDDWLANDPDIGTAGIDYLFRLAGMMATVGSVKSYAEKIRDTWRRRMVIEACEHMVNLTRDPGQLLETSAADHTARIDTLMTDQTISTAVSFDVALDNAMKRAEEAKARGGHGGISVPLFPRMNSAVAFLPEEFTILGGTPGEGKSALGWQIAISAAVRIRDLLQVKTVGGIVGISLEMSKELIATRAACAYAGVPVEAVIHGRLTDLQLEQLKDARAELRNLPIELIAVGGLTPTMIKMRLRQARRKFGGKLALVIIDHVQLVNADDRDNKGGGAWATGKIADALLALGKEFGCHVLALSQLDLKEIMKRPDKKPNKADLRWSANWAQNADNILFVHRPILHEPTTEPEQRDGEPPAEHDNRVQAWRDKRERLENQALLLVDKARNGRPGYAINLLFDGPTATFSEDPGHQQ